MRTVIGDFQEKRAGRIPATQKLNALRRDPCRGMKPLIPRPAAGRVSVAAGGAVADIGVGPEHAAHVRQIIIIFERVAVLPTFVVQKTVMKNDVVIPHERPWRFDMHLADALRMVSGPGKNAGQSLREFPFRVRIVSSKTVVFVLQPGHHCGTGRYTARTSRIGTCEIDPFPRQLVEMRRVRETGTVHAQRVAPHLIDHDHQNIHRFAHLRRLSMSIR